MWDTSTITNVGLTLLANWVEGTTLDICSAAGGTGTVQSSVLANQTALVNQKQTASIVSINRGASTVTVKLQFTAATASYTLNQIGIFAKIDTGEPALLALFQDETGVTIPTSSTGQEFLYTFYGAIAIDNTGSMTVTIDSSAYVSLSTFNEGLADKQDNITATGILFRTQQGKIVAANANQDFVHPDYLATVAHSGDYNDLDNRPDIPSKTSDLENDANFVDDNGLGEHNTDDNAHENLWIPGSYYGICSAAANAELKNVSVPKFALKQGCKIVVKFTNGETAATPRLNVNGTGSILIVSKGKSAIESADKWSAGDYVLFQYDGTNWVLLVNLALRFVALTAKGVANGVASLDANGTIPTAQIPSLSYVPTSEKGASNGVASLDKSGKVPNDQLPRMDYIPTSEKAVANGVATLGNDGKVPANQLRGGFIIKSTAPSDTTLLWIDSNSVLRYYNGSAWKPVVPVWG